MITLGITTTTYQLVLSPSTAQHSTRDLLYSNSINCSISVNVASMLCHTLHAFFSLCHSCTTILTAVNWVFFWLQVPLSALTLLGWVTARASGV